MVYIPNPSKPGETQEIEKVLLELMDLKRDGRWNLAGLEKWLEDRPMQLFRANRRLDEHLDELYPPKEGL